ncbi:Gfo/Idh/MocA family protein [Nocardiopsis sp. FIRDI 009]|uniref:Gfo/Idh/MocA family protein n=1 Tax=Nocardiopsis sp. FIRDI 009 TaxID=714197 RepID=UPI000E26C9B8|nr:Gfo/Idh/MocA family oxidoreductase [Nocardiopsis sp. FIRDI 009]
MTDGEGGLRWGVIGTGGIAHSFLEALRATPTGRVTAVGSRSAERARTFADTWGIAVSHGGYAELARDEDVDVVYVATPHPWHHSHALMCLEAGKHVLVEKPMAMNALQVAEMVAAARSGGLFLMEAMWTRYLPAYRLARDLVADGMIGRLCSLSAEFGINVPFDPDHRLFNAELGGGALLDLGVYPLALATDFLGDLTIVGATRQLSPDRMVDTHTTVLARGEGGVAATLSCASRSTMPGRAVLVGTEGWLEMDRVWAPTEVVVHRDGREPEVFHRPYRGNGYVHEAEEVARCVARGLSQSPDMPWSESLRLARLMDLVRDVGGFVDQDAESVAG